MLQIRFQGRGGQGAQTAGYILASTFFQAGKYVQAYSTYGGARRGTAVSTFIRVDDKPIRLRCDIENPDAIVCFDPSLLNEALLKGATGDTVVLISSSHPPEHFQNLGYYQLATIDGLKIAQANNLGRIVNSALVGAFAGLLQSPDIDLLTRVVKEMSPVKVQENAQACLDGYRMVQKRKR